MEYIVKSYKNIEVCQGTAAHLNRTLPLDSARIVEWLFNRNKDSV